MLVSADDIDDRDSSPRAEAKEWLAGTLVGGSIPAADVYRQARADGITERTLKRAKKELGVQSCRDGKNWAWFIPEVSDEESELVV